MSGGGAPAERVMIDNRSGLPDQAVQHAVETWWVENAALQFGTPGTFQTYAAEGSLLARSQFRTPANVIDEVKLARDLAERDDDIKAAMGAMLAFAYGKGMQNFHSDEQTAALYNEGARHINLDHVLKEIYREYLIAGSFTTVSLFTRTRLSFTPDGTDEEVNMQASLPFVGVLPAENIRVITTDLFGNGELAYHVEDSVMKEWLDEFFGDHTTAARKAEMRQEEPVAAALFTEKITVDWNDQNLFAPGMELYRLNPRMVHRTTMPKGAWAYPRPPLTANFALLEAKRLLNIMDYALLQGGTNYIVIAKKGSDQIPALPQEITNLQEQVRVAGKSGVLVGDHRLNIDIITPELKELLNPEKRNLLARKLNQSILRLPESAASATGESGDLDGHVIAEVITSDRRDIKRHVERHIYQEIAQRNRTKLKKGPAKLWFPNIVLSGQDAFTNYTLKLRDRGDIPRKWAVEHAGFDYEAGLAQRERELARGDDEILTPGDVPFNSPDAGPQDNQPGRPRSTSPNNGGRRDQPHEQDPARPRRVIRRTRGETVRASWDREREQTLRIGEITAMVLEQYPDQNIGRVSSTEREAIDEAGIIQRGSTAIVPVNCGYDVRELRAVNLREGLRMIVGNRTFDNAIVAKALVFREPEFTMADAEDMALRWGFTPPSQEEPEETAQVTVVPPPESNFDPAAMASAFASAIAAMPSPHLTVITEGGRVRETYERDASGNVTAVDRTVVPPEPPTT